MDPPGRRSDDTELYVTSANPILILEQSTYHPLNCPDPNAVSELVLGAQESFNTTLLESEPFLVGGSGYSCIGRDGKVSPFYVQIIAHEQIDHARKEVSLTVRPCHFSEMIHGRARLESPISSNREERRANLPEGATAALLLPPTGCVYSTKSYSIVEIWAAEATATTSSPGNLCPSGYPNINPLSLSTKWRNADPYALSGQTYNIDTHVVDATSATAIPTASACIAFATSASGGYFKSTPTGCSGTQDCTSTKEIGVDIPVQCATAPLDTCLPGTTPHTCSSSTAAFTGIVTTTCQKQTAWVATDVDSYRFHCCNADYANKMPLEYTQSFDYTNDLASTAGLITGQNMINSQNVAQMNMNAVLDVELSATKYNADANSGVMGNILIPSGVKKLDAYIDGTVDLKVDTEIKSGTVQTMLGPYQIVGQDDVADGYKKKVKEKIFMLGFIQVKVTLYVSLHVTVEVAAEFTLAQDIKFGAQLAGTLKFGGSYTEGSDFVEHKDLGTPTMTYQNPTLVYSNDFIPTATGKVTVTVTPTVYITMYDLVPLQFPVNIYAGLKFEKYAEGTSTNRDHCPGTHAALWYETFYGMDAQFRVEQLVVPDDWTLTTACNTAGYKCFGGMKLVCRDSSDTGFPLGPGSTTLKTTESTCGSGTDDFCKCLQYSGTEAKTARMFSATGNLADKVYWLKYPKSGMLTVVAETAVSQSDCPVCSGCLSNAPTNDAPTNAPTVAPTEVSQAVTISTLDSSSYSGTLKTNYEKGYGVAVGACASPCSSYNTGISISSLATDRRAATVTFVMTLSGISDTSAYTSGCSGSCTTSTLAAAISTATGTTVSVSTISTAGVTTSAPTTASGNTANSAIASGLLAVVCTLLNLMFC